MPAILVTVIQFLKKNWKIILVVTGILYFSGVFKNIVNNWKINKTVQEYKADPATIDYRFIAMQIHEAFDKALWFKDKKAVTSIINSLTSQTEFLIVVRIYAIEYNEDLREKLRKTFNDNKYQDLKWK